MKPLFSTRTILLAVALLALLAGYTARQTAAQARIDLEVKRAVVRIVPVSATAAGARRVEDQPGSGVIVHPSGIVLTAWHVLSRDDNFGQRTYWDDFVVEVIADDDSRPPVARFRAKIVAVRPGNDLALLRLDRRLDGQPVTATDLAGLAVLPVFTGSSAASRLLDPGNTDLHVFGYPKPFASEESELYVEPVTLSSRSSSRGELIVQQSFDAGYSGGSVLVEAEGGLAVAGIVLSARGSRTVMRDLAERFREFEWVAGEQRATLQDIQVSVVGENTDPSLQFDLTVDAVGLEGEAVQLQIGFYDANSHLPWKPGDVGLLRRSDGSAYWEEEIRPDRPLVSQLVPVSFSLNALGVAAEGLAFRLMLYDKATGRQLWSDLIWYQTQSSDTVQATSTPTPTATAILDLRSDIEAAVRATLTASAPTPLPTGTPTPRPPTPTETPRPDAEALIVAAVNATLTALAPTATSTATATETPTATATPNAAATFQAAVNATLTALAPRATPTPTRRPSTSTPTVTPTPIMAAGAVREIDGIPFVYVPAGEFTMGSDDSETDFAVEICNQFYTDTCQRDWFADESPQHQIYVDGYWVMRTEVTNAQYRQFVDANGYTTERYWTAEGWKWRGDNSISLPSQWSDGRFNGAEYPVVGVSWYEAVAYANWLAERTGLALRLPTEAEWEKAARGTDGRIYPWGNGWDGSRLNYCDSNCTYEWADKNRNDGYQYTAPVGSYPVGASPYGAYDMAGNVWEWVQDWYTADYYAGSLTRNPQGPESGDRRVLRGGSWDGYPTYVRAAHRGWGVPDNRSYDVGFRVVAPGL